VADSLHLWRNWRDRLAGLERRVATEKDPVLRAYYQAWLTAERGHTRQAMAEYRAVRATATPGSRLQVQAALRLGRLHGEVGEYAEELAIYEGLMAQHPAASLIAQGMYYTRRGDRDRARALLDEALARDAVDGSLGEDRALARSLRNNLRPAGAPAKAQ
jgi:hypothetical protein